MSVLLAFLFTITTAISSRFVPVTQPSYNADLSAIRWEHGVPLIMLNNLSAAEDNAGLYVFSGDGKIHNKFDSITVTEFLSPQKLLLGNTSLYFITPEDSRFIKQSAGRIYQHLSLSPQQDFLEYDPVDSSIHCISTFDFQTLGPCVDVTALLPQQWNWATEAYIDTQWDSNWNKTSNQYVIRVRSRQLYDLVPSNSANMPAVQVQREIARFSYNPTTQIVEMLSLDEPITLKTPDIFLTTSDQSLLEYFQPGADIAITSNQFDQSVGIAQRSMDIRAKLADVDFIGDMPGFEVVTYKSLSK